MSLTHITHISSSSSITVTVTEALVLRPLLEDRGRIIDRMKQKCFQITTKQVQLNSTTHSVSAKTGKKFIIAVISRHYYVACLWLFSPWWSCQFRAFILLPIPIDLVIIIMIILIIMSRHKVVI